MITSVILNGYKEIYASIQLVCNTIHYEFYHLFQIAALGSGDICTALLSVLILLNRYIKCMLYMHMSIRFIKCFYFEFSPVFQIAVVPLLYHVYCVVEHILILKTRSHTGIKLLSYDFSNDSPTSPIINSIHR